jgi:hypothetical protein
LDRHFVGLNPGAIMASEPMVRTIYTDPTTSGLVRQGPTAHAESMVDQVRYAQPLERVHGSGLHDWGIGEGLALAVTLNQPGVRVLPGVGVDAAGRHISLAEAGKAEVGPNADDPNVAPMLTEVLATGALLPTTGLNGSFFVSVRWRETFDVDLWNSSNQTVFQMLHTPWLKLEPAAGVNDATDDGSRLLLGRVTLAAGNVTAMTHERRREAGMPAGSLKFWRGETTGAAPNLKAENTLTAELRARAAGGLEVKVPGATDQIEFKRDAGNISRVVFGADVIAGRMANGRETVLIDTNSGNIHLGTQGVHGDVVVNDSSNRRVFVVDGSTASVTVGAAGHEGDIRTLDSAGQVSMHVDGSTGDMTFRGLLRDPAGSHGGIGHALLRHLPALTNGGFTGLHRHLNSGNAARARIGRLHANSNNGPSTLTISFNSARQMCAYAALSFVDPRDPFDRADLLALEIYRIDGQDFREWWISGGDHLGASGDDANCRSAVFVGTASSVTFRLRTFVNVDCGAMCVVFPEF